MLKKSFVVLSLLLASCCLLACGIEGASAGPSPSSTSGSRLKAQVVVGEDGSSWEAGIWDSKRSHQCLFTGDEEGKPRCLPSGVDVTTTLVAFRDAACAEPLFGSPKGACAAAFGISYTAGSQCGGSRGVVYGLTPTARPARGFAKVSGGACVDGGPLPDIYDYYLGARIAPAEFVAGERR